MTAADELSARQAAGRSTDSQPALWRDPLWLGLGVLFIGSSAVLIGAIAGRAAA
ncbi:MAG: hypothetical protein ACI8S3_001993, partial [Alphaproteobacteria bacterium]